MTRHLGAVTDLPPVSADSDEAGERTPGEGGRGLLRHPLRISTSSRSRLTRNTNMTNPEAIALRNLLTSHRRLPSARRTLQWSGSDGLRPTPPPPASLRSSPKALGARDIAKVLGPTGRGDGFLHGNGYTVTWAIGHLVPWRSGRDPARVEEVEPAAAPHAAARVAAGVPEDTRDQFRGVKKVITRPRSSGSCAPPTPAARGADLPLHL